MPFSTPAHRLFLPRAVVAALLATTGLTATGLAAPAAAQPAARSYDIPAGPLAPALNRFAGAAGVRLVYAGEIAHGLASPGLRGPATVGDGFTALLAGTGLVARETAPGTYTVAEAPRAAPVKAEVQTAQRSAVQAPPPARLDEVVVYARLRSVNTLDVPQSVEILDSALIAATASSTVGDALRFIPGASRDGSTLDAFGDTYLIRGFYANQTVNGITANPLRQARDTVSVERIEVLKGPASVLYGQLQPGAVVNIVTKQPQRDFAGEASLSYGSHDEWRGTVDLTGPLIEGGTARFRLTGAYDDAESQVDFWHRRHLFVAPSVAVDFGEDTTATVEAFYTRNRLAGFFNGVPAEGTLLPNPNGRLAHSLSLTDPTFDPSTRTNVDVSARLEHRFSDSVTWRGALSWTREKASEEGVFGLLGWSQQYRRLSRAILASSSDGDTWSATTDVAVDLTTGGIDHALAIGGSHSWFDRDTRGSTALAPDLDLYAPTYATNARPATTVIASRNSLSEEKTRATGLYLQDRIALTDSLKLVGGVRWSRYEQDNRSSRGGGAFVPSRQTQTSWTSQLGVLYAATDRLSWFANRTTSFLPVQGLTASGAALKPETGTEYEIGAKAALADGKLALSASLFHLERGDVAVADRGAPGFLLAIGEQEAKGFDLSVRAEPVEGATLYAGYAFTDAETSKHTDPALVGARIRNIPKHSLVLQGDYAFQAGPLAGLTLGGGATYTADRAGDIGDSFEVPGYWRFDLRADYEVTDAMTLGVRIDNLADKRYYTHAYSLFEVWPGTPRTVKVSLTGRF